MKISSRHWMRAVGSRFLKQVFGKKPGKIWGFEAPAHDFLPLCFSRVVPPPTAATARADARGRRFPGAAPDDPGAASSRRMTRGSCGA